MQRTYEKRVREWNEWAGEGETNKDFVPKIAEYAPFYWDAGRGREEQPKDARKNVQADVSDGVAKRSNFLLR